LKSWAIEVADNAVFRERRRVEECIGLLSPTDVQLLVSPASTLSVRNELARDLARVNVNGGAAAIRQ